MSAHEKKPVIEVFWDPNQWRNVRPGCYIAQLRGQDTRWDAGSTAEEAIVEFLKTALPLGLPTERDAYEIAYLPGRPKS